MKKLIFSVVIALILLAQFSIALTASIGNSRMILRPAPSETIERSIHVKNVNDIPVTVEVFPSGELEDSIKIEEETFELFPGQEKDVYFEIKAPSSGSSESSINIKFLAGGQGTVGLSSTIILIVDEDEEENIDDTGTQQLDLPIEQDAQAPLIEDAINLQDAQSGAEPNQSIFPAAVILLLISSIVLAIALIALLTYSTKAKKSKTK